MGTLKFTWMEHQDDLIITGGSKLQDVVGKQRLNFSFHNVFSSHGTRYALPSKQT